MTIYSDRKGNPVNIGDILKYDEGEGYGRSIDEVIDVEGEPHAITKVGCPEWTQYADAEPIHLQFFKLYASCKDEVLRDAEVIGNIRDNPEMLTADYANEIWPAPELFEGTKEALDRLTSVPPDSKEQS